MKKEDPRAGYALVIAVLVMSILMISLGMIMQLGRQRIHTAKRHIERTRAIAYAEAAIDYAYAILSEDFDLRKDSKAFQLPAELQARASEGSFFQDGVYRLVMGQADGSDGDSSFGDAYVESDFCSGSFGVNLTSVSNRYVIINAGGRCGTAEGFVEVVIEDIYAGSGSQNTVDYSDMDGFNYAILSGGDFSFKGCGTVDGGDCGKLHSNSRVDINGSARTQVNVSSSMSISVGNNTVIGTLSAPQLDLHKKADITGGTSQVDVSPVLIPDIDLTPYYNWANTNNEVYENGFTTSSDYTPIGGVLYVIGDVHISGHATINGSIIATGNIHVSGHVEIVPTQSVFAMATESGHIVNTSSATINGLVYSKIGNYKQTANGTLVGQIIVGGTVQKGGNSDIILYQKCVPTPPGVTTVTPVQSLPLISGWQK